MYDSIYIITRTLYGVVTV